MVDYAARTYRRHWFSERYGKAGIDWWIPYVLAYLLEKAGGGPGFKWKRQRSDLLTCCALLWMLCQIRDINRSYSCARFSIHTSDLSKIIGNATRARRLGMVKLTLKKKKKGGTVKSLTPVLSALASRLFRASKILTPNRTRWPETVLREKLRGRHFTLWHQRWTINMKC